MLHRKQHLFLRAHEALTQEQQEDRARIGSHLPLLETAWCFKEALRTWYASATAETAEKLLDDWIAQVKQEGPEPMCTALSAFVHWRQQLLALLPFLQQPSPSHARVKAKNNRTKALMRQAYSYRNRQHLRLRILLGNVA